MKFAPSRRKSIRYSIFIGVLAGSVFSGSGAFANPTPVNSVEQLLGVTGNASYVLTRNLDLLTEDANGSEDGEQYADAVTLGDPSYISNEFTGIFNGGDFTISGLTKPLFDTISNEVKDLNLATAPCNEGACGVIGSGALANTLGADGTVVNVDVTGKVSGYGQTGGLVGTSSGSISDSTVNDDVSGGENVGGLVGRLERGATITNSHTTGNVGGVGVVGGLVGYSAGSILTSTASGIVSSNVPLNDLDNKDIGGLVGVLHAGATITDSNASGYVSGRLSIGGLVGFASGTADELPSSSITNSYATGDVHGVTDVGGLVGLSESDITDSWSEGDVEGGARVGGLVGSSENDITNSYAKGNVIGSNEISSGEYIGGLVGWSEYVITGSHATGDVEGGARVGGLVGFSLYEITDSWSEGDVSGVSDVGGLAGFSSGYITGSHATGNVIGSGQYIGGLVGDAYGTIEDSFATGDVTGTGVDSTDFHGIGGLIGYLGGNLNNSYATGVVRGFVEIGGLVGSLGTAVAIISNSHATGDVYGEEFVGGLVGYLDNPSQSISNAYATGDVTGEGYWIGGLVGTSFGNIQNSYATGDVTGTSYVGGLVGDLYGLVQNSYATGDVTGSSHFDNFIGFVSDGASVDGLSGAFSKSSPDAPSILSVVNTAGIAGAPAFEIVTCKNNGLPLLSALSASYADTCPVSSNRINGFIQPTLITEIAKALGFVISPKFPNDSSIGFIKNEKELDISKILGAQKAADRVAWTSMKTGEALQISYNFDSKDPIELWIKLPDGKWILAGVINFDKNGKAVLPPKQFKVAGEYVLVLNKPSEDSIKANAPLNQIGTLTVFVN